MPAPNPEAVPHPKPEAPPPSGANWKGKKISTGLHFADFVQDHTPKSQEGRPLALIKHKEKQPTQLELTKDGHDAARKLYDHIVETNPGAEYTDILRQLRGVRKEVETLRKSLIARSKSTEEIQALTARFTQEHLILDDAETRHLGSQLAEVDPTTKELTLKEEVKTTWGLYKKLINLSVKESKQGISTPEDAVIENLTKAGHYAEITGNEQLAALIEKETALHRHYIERMTETMALEGEYSSSPWLAIRNHFAEKAKLPERFFTYQIAGSIVAAKETIYQHTIQTLGDRTRSFSPSQIKQAMEIALHEALPQDAEELLATNPPADGETARDYIYRACGIELKKDGRIVTNTSLTEKTIEHLDHLEERLTQTSVTDVEKATEISHKQVAKRLLADIRGLFTRENIGRLFSRDTLRRLTTKETAVRVLRAQGVLMNLAVPFVLTPTGQEFIHDVGDFLDDHMPQMPFGTFLENFTHQAETVLGMMQDAQELLPDPMEDFLQSTAEHLPDLVTHVGPALEYIDDRAHTVLSNIRDEFASRAAETSVFARAAAEEMGDFVKTVTHPEAHAAAEPGTPPAVEHPAISPKEYSPGPSPAPEIPTAEHVVRPEEHHLPPPPATSPEPTATPHPQVSEEAQLRQEMKDLREIFGEEHLKQAAAAESGVTPPTEEVTTAKVTTAETHPEPTTPPEPEKLPTSEAKPTGVTTQETPPAGTSTPIERFKAHLKDQREYVVHVKDLPPRLQQVLEADGNGVTETTIEIGAQRGAGICVGSQFYAMAEAFLPEDEDIKPWVDAKTGETFSGFEGFIRQFNVREGLSFDRWAEVLHNVATHFDLVDEKYDLSAFTNASANPQEFLNFIKGLEGKTTIWVLDDFDPKTGSEYHAGMIIGSETVNGESYLYMTDGNAVSGAVPRFKETWTDPQTGEQVIVNVAPGVLRAKLTTFFFEELLGMNANGLHK